MAELSITTGERGRSALVPAAQALLTANALILAITAWVMVPLDVHTSTAYHARVSTIAFALWAASALVFGGWKAVLLSCRRGTGGTLVSAWLWLSAFA
ncbi:MAG: hypothetical protein ACXVYV_10195, partial [Gaiellales bacterium]